MHNAEVTREKQINIRLSEEEAARLDFLTTHHAINPSALFRMLLKREEDRVRRELADLDAAARAREARMRAVDRDLDELQNQPRRLDGGGGLPIDMGGAPRTPPKKPTKK